MPMPFFESLVVGSTFAPGPAQSAGLLDAVAENDARLSDAARAAAGALTQVDPATFQAMRRVTRGGTADRIRTERAKL
jgi:enoyl-CoA hydratase/carnithine racemase